MITSMHDIIAYRDEEEGLRFVVPSRRAAHKPPASRVMKLAQFRRWLKRHIPEVLNG